jgi:hypothetical protein
MGQVGSALNSPGTPVCPLSTGPVTTASPRCPCGMFCSHDYPRLCLQVADADAPRPSTFRATTPHLRSHRSMARPWSERRTRKVSSCTRLRVSPVLNLGLLGIPCIPSHSVVESGWRWADTPAIWHFTLYWTLILLGGTFFLTSIFASFNLFLSLSVFRPKLPKRHSTAPSGIRTPSEHPPSSRSTGASTTPSKSPTNGTGPGQADTGRRERIGRVGRVGRVGRIGPKRPPLWLVALIPLTTGVVAGVISLVSATVVGFALAAVYSAGGFVMST